MFTSSESADYAVSGSYNRCGLAMLHKLAGANPAQVIASQEPGIEPCRHERKRGAKVTNAADPEG